MAHDINWNVVSIDYLCYYVYYSFSYKPFSNTVQFLDFPTRFRHCLQSKWFENHSKFFAWCWVWRTLTTKGECVRFTNCVGAASESNHRLCHDSIPSDIWFCDVILWLMSILKTIQDHSDEYIRLSIWKINLVLLKYEIKNDIHDYKYAKY